MNHRSLRRSRSLLAFAALAAALSAQAPVGFPETYALAAERAKVVETLIPGSEEWYYYHCRERLDARDFKTVGDLLQPWIQRHGRTGRVLEIENRSALLDFDQNREQTFDFLRRRLGLEWNHERVVPGAKSTLPTQFDPALLSPTALSTRALAAHPGTVDGFEDAALPMLASTNLTPDQLHSLLGRLQRCDVANLPALVVRDLDHRQSGGFGSLAVHKLLRRAQLEQCAQLRPALLNDPSFVDTYLARLEPNADTIWQSDPALRQAQLQRLYEFAQRLAPSHNSLKAHILNHWLQHDLAAGRVDKERFLAYVRLPRQSGPVATDYVKRFQARGQDFVDLSRSYGTGLPAIGNDTDLLRACLEQLFATEDTIDAYAEFLDARWLRTVLAEAKILRGVGDMERWYSLLDDPRYLEALEKRVEITFPPTQPVRYGAGDAVALDVDTKNVPKLLLKVYVVDTYRYLVEKQKDVDATIELDGLVANHEQAFEYSDAPLRRVRRHFDLPMLKAPGTYVVELVGNGISSRAVIHKGWLRHAERTAAAGQVFSVFDEKGALQQDALLWFGGREYRAGERGEILVPFSTDPGQKRAVLRVGDRAELVTFEHRAESYALAAHTFVEREALVAGRTAHVVMRPDLRLGGHAVSLQLLTDVVLVVTATDLDGTTRVDEVRDPKIADGAELDHAITVPERLQSLTVALRGKVKDLAGKDVQLDTGATSFAVNGIDATDATFAAQLQQDASGYTVELRGKNGETVADRACTVTLRHEHFRDPVAVALQSDQDGRIALGTLPGVKLIEVEVQGGTHAWFAPAEARVTVPAQLHGLAGGTLRVPYAGAAKTPTRQAFSLFGSEDDAFDHLAIADGFLELRDLAPGDYQLWLFEAGAMVPVRVTAGAKEGNWLVGRNRILQAGQTAPLQIGALTADGDGVRIGVANFSASTRVHVVTTRYLPAHPLFEGLGDVQRDEDLGSWFGDGDASTYHAGRKLGDEYRYVLERRFATKFAGNMLERPGLLLNRWALDRVSTNAAIGLGGGAGGRYGGRAGGRAMRKQGGEGMARDEFAGHIAQSGGFPNLDWLPMGAATVLNLRPDQNGVVTVPGKDLGIGQMVHVIAIDGDESVYRTAMRTPAPLQPRARTLAQALPPNEHFLEQKRIEFVAAGKEAVIGDARSADVEIFDSLAGVFHLMSTISRDDDLAKFAFVLRWPGLEAAEKQKLYGEHACHELDFFLYQKDRAFFDAVIKPYLANKLQKTFLDEWLLGTDLRGWLEPWSFARLNLVEKILLAQRLAGDERQAVARVVKEQLELRPIDRERIDHLFDVTLAANELRDASRAAGLELLEKAKAPAEPAQTVAEKPGAPAAPAPGGGKDAGGLAGPTTGGPAGPAAAKEERARRANRPDRQDQAEQELAEDRKPSTGTDDFFLGGTRGEDKKLSEELLARGLTPMLYRAVEPTRVLVESNYWRRTREDTTPDLIAPNHFWVDYATAAADQQFVSPAFVEASTSFAEMMFALSVLDLPFAAGKHEVTAEGDMRRLRAATPLLLVRKEVAPVAPAEDEPPLLLGENFFRQDDRYHFVDGEQREAFVNDEFLTSVPYGAQVVVSNPTGQRRVVDLLLQVPAGAIPIRSGFWTRSQGLELNPYETKSIEYGFYFPASGDFAHYPVHAAAKGKLVAAATPRTMHVVVVPTHVDARSWEHVSQQGSAAEVLAYLDANNVQRLDLTKIAWRMKDREFFATALQKLRARHVYDGTLWSYGILHRDLPATREYLRHADAFLAACGAALESALVTIDPVERGTYEQVELDPLVHARTHRLGGQNVIGNSDLAGQYGRLLDVLGYRARLSSDDWLAVTYYMLLQNRVEDAMAAFAKVERERVATLLQYDYMAAYLSFFTMDLQRARQIAERHRDEAVEPWRQRFAEVLHQLDEAEGRQKPAEAEVTPDALAATAPALDVYLDGRRLRIAHKNLPQCEVRYYELDVEFAFSSQPFASTSGGAAAYVQPNLHEVKALPQDGGDLAFELPQQFWTKNVLIEVRAGGLVRSQTYFANALDVRFLESYGQVAVTDPASKRPLPRTYVKVFARLPNGQVRFHKDGYTDLRGRFDYASLSDDPNAGANRYAVLVLSDQLGAVIREVAPPVR